MHYFLQIPTTNKAKADIDVLLLAKGFRSLAVDRGRGGLGRFLTKAEAMLRLWTTLRKGDVLFLQYPMKKFYRTACHIAHRRGAHVVTIVHDLGAFRRKKLTDAAERHLLEHTDFLIVHNEAMRAHLLRHGNRMPIFCLDLFDYLSEAEPQAFREISAPYRVVFAGGLGRHRSGFLYALDGHIKNYELHLYGGGLHREELPVWENIVYHGHVSPDDFIRGVHADFGLVWDGDSIDECRGAWGEYLKINNPHKASFYLRTGLPLIVWEQSAMARYLLAEGVALSVASLRDIPTAIATLSPSDYKAMRERAIALGDRLGQGFYPTRALDAARQSLRYDT